MQPHPIDLHALIENAARPEARFVVFKIVARAVAAGVALDEAAESAIAAAVGCPVARVRRVARFTARLAAARGVDVFRCVSVSCTLNGAAALGRELTATLPALDVREVHCLDQCERGPSLRVGESIYVGGLDDVVTDERTWRDDPIPT